MTPRPRWTFGPLALALLASAPAPADDKADKKEGPNLLVNGSFEDGPDVDTFTSLDKDSRAIKGWVVVKGQIDFVGRYWEAADGKRSLDLHGSPGVGGVAQTFKTEKGKNYRVTFHLAANPSGSVAKKTMAARAAGKEMEFTADATDTSPQNMKWQKKTWEFTAADAETTLELVSTMEDDTSWGPALDHVSVVAVE